ncbi:hypothetical protein DJ018_01585 [Phenylobacterium deserti]|uniref:Uncharacterized protein n=1 Tax=Phenylobacterium deserti TaxID=1914756 RepID=A0A328AQ26_9CAUL|nr:hypothetical protein DJ018_01585 [Phenylobacterium deserti]
MEPPVGALDVLPMPPAGWPAAAPTPDELEVEPVAPTPDPDIEPVVEPDMEPADPLPLLVLVSAPVPVPVPVLALEPAPRPVLGLTLPLAEPVAPPIDEPTVEPAPVSMLLEPVMPAAAEVLADVPVWAPAEPLHQSRVARWRGVARE